MKQFWTVKAMCILAVSALSTTSPVAADVLASAKVDLEQMQLREGLVLEGVQWEWKKETGRSATLDDAFRGEYLPDEPVDHFQCRWLCNDNRYLYESIAQQPFRIIGDDPEKQVMMTTGGSEVYLTTLKSQVLLLPDETLTLNVMSHHAHGPMSPPGGVPVHSGRFGLGRVQSLRDRLDAAADDEVVVETGECDDGVPARILSIKDRGALNRYYFSLHNGLLMQTEWWKDDALRGKMRVLRTMRVTRGSQSLVLPADLVSCSKPAGKKTWRVHRVTTQRLEWKPAPLDELAVELQEGTRFSVRPYGHLVSVEPTRKLTAQNLDGIVEAAYERVLRKQGKQMAGTGDPEEDHISWVGASVLGGLLVIGAMVLARRRIRRAG